VDIESGNRFFLCVIGPKRQLFLGSAKRISEFGFFRSTLLCKEGNVGTIDSFNAR